MVYAEFINIIMKEDFLIDMSNIRSCSDEFKDKIKSTIKYSRCSITTAIVFLKILNTELEEESIEDINIVTLIHKASLFVDKALGLNPTSYNEILTNKDFIELRLAINNTDY